MCLLIKTKSDSFAHSRFNIWHATWAKLIFDTCKCENRCGAERGMVLQLIFYLFINCSKSILFVTWVDFIWHSESKYDHLYIQNMQFHEISLFSKYLACSDWGKLACWVKFLLKYCVIFCLKFPEMTPKLSNLDKQSQEQEFEGAPPTFCNLHGPELLK